QGSAPEAPQANPWGSGALRQLVAALDRLRRGRARVLGPPAGPYPARPSLPAHAAAAFGTGTLVVPTFERAPGPVSVATVPVAPALHAEQLIAAGDREHGEH